MKMKSKQLPTVFALAISTISFCVGCAIPGQLVSENGEPYWKVHVSRTKYYLSSPFQTWYVNIYAPTNDSGIVERQYPNWPNRIRLQGEVAFFDSDFIPLTRNGISTNELNAVRYQLNKMPWYYPEQPFIADIIHLKTRPKNGVLYIQYSGDAARFMTPSARLSLFPHTN